MTRWLLKGCPRCGGDLLDDEDGEGYGCFQCGFEGRPLLPEPVPEQELPPQVKVEDPPAPARRGKRRLSGEEKRERDVLIIERCLAGASHVALAGEFDISASMISLIVRGTR